MSHSRVPAVCPVCELPWAADELSPRRALLLPMAQASGLQAGAAGTATVCTLVRMAAHLQVGTECPPKDPAPSTAAEGAVQVGGQLFSVLSVGSRVSPKTLSLSRHSTSGW